MKARALTNNAGPALMVMPNEKVAKKYSRKRWRPFVDLSPALAALKPTARDEYSLLEQHFLTASLFLVGSNSAANLASEPIKYLFADEVDKYPDETDGEADALSLAYERLTTYDDSKGVDASTPTLPTGAIWKTLGLSDWRRYFCPCPRCAQLLCPTWSDFWWPPEAKRDDGYDFELVLDETRLICPHCDGEVHNREKPAMAAAGTWVPSKPGAPGHLGYHFPAFMSLWASCDWGRLAVAFLLARGSPTALRNVVNSKFCEPWEPRAKKADEADILEHRLDYAAGTVPEPPLRIFLTVDKQHDCWVYVVRAWCRFETSYLVEHGVCETLPELVEVSQRRYQGPHERHAIDRVYVDSGDDTLPVYRICRRYGWKPTKGERSSASVDSVRTGKGKDGTKILLFQAEKFKEDLLERLAIAPDQPGAWRLHATASREYARQVAGERQLEVLKRDGRTKREWRQVYANHYLDCEVLQLVAAKVNNVGQLQARPPAAAPAPARRPTQAGFRVRRAELRRRA